MKILRTPDARFENLPDFPFAPHYCEVTDSDGGALRIHYLDEGPTSANPVLLLHGEPSWSFLYRRIVASLAARGIASSRRISSASAARTSQPIDPTTPSSGTCGG